MNRKEEERGGKVRERKRKMGGEEKRGEERRGEESLYSSILVYTRLYLS